MPDRDCAVVEHELRWFALDWQWLSLEKAVGGDEEHASEKLYQRCD